MSNHHPVPRLFVSRRNDKSPNGFNCAICRKDVSFLSRGPRVIWRHCKCKGHLAKDQRYRLDHEDLIYTDNLDAISVAEISAELRAEIEKTPPVTLGKMNKFLEDEVDALVGVPSNVPPTTLVGCLLELLRSGGSQAFLRRLWNQFRTTLPVESPYASVTWSKTETVVVLVQTLYPRVLRRVKSWLEDSSFSLALLSSSSGVRCTVRCCSGDSVREIRIVDENYSAVSSEAYIRCLSRVLSLVSTRRGPVAIGDCPPVLFNAYVDWCRLVGRPVPLVSVTFSDQLLRRLVNDASFSCVGSVDPFATVEYLVQRLKRVRQQAWLLELPQLRLCLENGDLPVGVLCEVLLELLDHWADVKLCLSNDVFVIRKTTNVTTWTLCCVQTVLVFHDWHWSLLSKVKKVIQLPTIDDWFNYIDKPLNSWANVPVGECLQGEISIQKALRGLEESPRRSFLRECQSYLLELLKQLSSSAYPNSRIARSLSCLSVHMLLGGDADYVIRLFEDLDSCLQEAGYLDDLDRESSVNEFKSLVVDLRQLLMDSSQIVDVFEYLETNGSYQCRAHVRQVVRLVRVIVCPVSSGMPAVDISVSGTNLAASVVRSGLNAVQSFVLHPKFMSSDLLTFDCVEELKVNLPVGHHFLARDSFDPWVDVSRHPVEDVYKSLFQCYTAYYSGQVDEWRARMSSGQATSRVVSGSAAVTDVGSIGISDIGQGVSATASSSKTGGKKNCGSGKSC